MNDLPNYLPGYPPMSGIKEESPKYYQGDRISICIPIEDPSLYKLRAWLGDTSEGGIVWVGTQKNGIDIIEGKVFINIKSTVARNIPSGIYYLAVTGATKQDISTWTTLAQQTIDIVPSVGSPYPIIQEGQKYLSSMPTQSTTIAFSNTSIAWYEGTTDNPPSDIPSNKNIAALYSGENGTFFRWSVADQKWIAIVR